MRMMWKSGRGSGDQQNIGRSPSEAGRRSGPHGGYEYGDDVADLQDEDDDLDAQEMAILREMSGLSEPVDGIMEDYESVNHSSRQFSGRRSEGKGEDDKMNEGDGDSDDEGEDVLNKKDDVDLGGEAPYSGLGSLYPRGSVNHLAPQKPRTPSHSIPSEAPYPATTSAHALPRTQHDQPFHQAQAPAPAQSQNRIESLTPTNNASGSAGGVGDEEDGTGSGTPGEHDDMNTATREDPGTIGGRAGMKRSRQAFTKTKSQHAKKMRLNELGESVAMGEFVLYVESGVRVDELN